jgi:hypothetical protein
MNELNQILDHFMHHPAAEAAIIQGDKTSCEVQKVNMKYLMKLFLN